MSGVLGNSPLLGRGGIYDQFKRWVDELARIANNLVVHGAIPALENSATPSVAAGFGHRRKFLTGGTTTITDILDGYEGLEIVILAGHAVTITDGTNIFLNGSGNFAMNSSDTLTLIQKADGNWYEIARSDNT